MINNNILGLIGLAMKAGKVAFGADSVEESILKRKVKLVIVSKESSERTKSKFSKICEKYNISGESVVLTPTALLRTVWRITA